MQKKTVAALATGTVLVLGIGSVGVNEAMAKTVTVSIDGTPTEVRTYAGSVGQMLEKDGIKLGAHDVVAPGLDTRLTEGAQVSVQYARPVTVTIDGQARQIWTTATSVDQVLAMLQMTDSQAVLSTSRSAGIGREGLSFSVTTSKAVKLVVDGKSTDVTSTARTVGDLLKEHGIEANDKYKVEPGLTTVLTDGLKVDVTTPKAVTLVVDGKTTQVSSTVGTVGDLLKQQKVSYDDSYTISPGMGTALSNGLRITVTKPAPKPAPKPTPSATTPAAKPSPAPAKTSAPAPAPTTSAPKATTAPQTSSSGIPTSTWDSIAQCESGGNWAINTGNGYYGGLQFNLSTWQAYGGSGLPSDASKETQIAIATKVQAAQGWGAWPACTSKLGLS